MLCVKFGWKWHSGSGEEDESVKSLQTDSVMDEQTTRIQESWLELIIYRIELLIYQSQIYPTQIALIIYEQIWFIRKECLEMKLHFIHKCSLGDLDFIWWDTWGLNNECKIITILRIYR